MWVWRCPKNLQLKNEHHTAHMARVAVIRHAMQGAPTLNIPPCGESHEITDDGVPCQREDCTIPYIPKN